MLNYQENLTDPGGFAYLVSELKASNHNKNDVPILVLQVHICVLTEYIQMVKFVQVIHNSQETLFIQYYTVYIYSNKTDNLGMLATTTLFKFLCKF